ncbi:MAG: sulfatase-like hydrolase/transferase [Candidatus Sumerlaeota bacterium]|nr:sulfatase-like hydrolase/transferase [Candidatus Sumerlaeota bacterium]
MLQCAQAADEKNAGTSPNANATPPNIVYILADDMGYGDVSALNKNAKIKTPNIDRLAREGMSFTDAHAGAAVCTPTRYGILTGRYPWRSRLKSGVLNGYSPRLIEEGRLTTPALLKSNGYHTACIGKWHLGMDWPGYPKEGAEGDAADGAAAKSAAAKPQAAKPKAPHEAIDYTKPIANSPTALGFDYFYGISASLDMFPYIYIENNRTVGVPTTTKAFHRPGPAQADFEAIDVLKTLTDKAVAHLHERAAAKQPFFLYLALTAPHTPIVPRQEFQGKSGLHPYLDFCLEVDWTVGQILKALDDAKLSSSTLIIFTSDNGFAPYVDKPKEMEKSGHFPSYIYRGYKADIFEGGHRIPFFARWPGVVKPGAVCDETICLTDLMATAADIVKVKLPENAGEDSVSILPALQGKNIERPLREATVHQSINGQLSIRQGQWKLEMCPGSGGWGEPTDPEARKQGLPARQLYDLKADPGEKNNIYDKHPDVVRRLTALLAKYVKEGRSTPGAPQQNTPAGKWPQIDWMKTEE